MLVVTEVIVAFQLTKKQKERNQEYAILKILYIFAFNN